MDYENVLISKENHIATITVNRPEVLNALTTPTLIDIENALKEAINDDDVKVIVLTGAGDKAFIAGSDILEMKDYDILDGRDNILHGRAITNTIMSTPKPVIAAINGYALGGGCEIAMSCDIRIASENASFGQPEAQVGITPGFGGTKRLVDIVGMGRAKYMLFTGWRIDAEEALRYGLVEQVVPLDTLYEQVNKIAEKIMKNSMLAVGLIKMSINNGNDLDFRAATNFEMLACMSCFALDDFREGMQAFVEKRKPDFGWEPRLK